jgi:peptide/nickel transport system permease protein
LLTLTERYFILVIQFVLEEKVLALSSRVSPKERLEVLVKKLRRAIGRRAPAVEPKLDKWIKFLGNKLRRIRLAPTDLARYIFRRAVDSTITFFFVFLLNFFLFFTRMDEVQGMTQTEQFAAYLRFVFIDHFGILPPPDSAPTVMHVLSYMSPTIVLLVSSVLLIFVFSLLFGAAASYKYGKLPDLLITSILVFICMIPAWWLALIIRRTGPPLLGINALSPFYAPVMYNILPALSILLCLCGIFFLVIRNSMVNIYIEKYIMLAKAKGVSIRTLLFKHAMRNALLAITAMMAIAPFLVVNQLVPIERVFNTHGIGYLLLDSLISTTGYERIPLATVQVIFLTLATIIIVSHLILDVAQHVLDPRLKFPTKATDGGFTKKLRRKTMSRRKRLALFLRSFKKTKTGILGLVILSTFVIIAVLVPILPLANPEQMGTASDYFNPPDPFLDKLVSHFLLSGGIKIGILSSVPPFPPHLLGTDEYGRDVLSRLLWGARISLFEGITATLIALSIGCLVGLVAGYYQGRWFAYLADRLTEVFLSMPILIFVVFFPLEIGELYYDFRAVFRWILAIGLSTWAITAKLVKSQVILAKERPYVEASKAMGANDRHILWHYILPEAVPVMVSSVVYIATIVLAMQSTLDFFGFRRRVWAPHSPSAPTMTNAPFVSWGTLLSYSTVSTSGYTFYWWTIVPAAFCIAFLGLAMVLIGNKVADALNPEL